VTSIKGLVSISSRQQQAAHKKVKVKSWQKSADIVVQGDASFFSCPVVSVIHGS
jgi:hypothetical protein